MNLVQRNGAILGFRPEHLLPKELLHGGELMEFTFGVHRVEYLGSERVLYGGLDGFPPDLEVTAKLPAHVHLPGLGEGERHSFAVRRANLRHFDQRSGERIEQR
jgi:multiple sugar transport system ATP-binding protein